MHDYAKGQNLVSKWLNIDELRKTLPNVSKNCLGATFNQLSGQVNPGVLVEAIAQACRLNGVLIVEGNEVVGIKKVQHNMFSEILGAGYQYEVATENGDVYLARNIIKAEGTSCDKIVPVKGHIMIGKVRNMSNMVFYCSDAYAEWEKTCTDPKMKGLSLNQKPTHIYGKVLNGEIMIGGGRKLVNSKNDFGIDV